MKKEKFGFQKPSVEKEFKHTSIQRNDKMKEIREKEKEENEIEKVVSQTPLNIGIASLNENFSPAAIINFISNKGIDNFTKRQVFFTPINVFDTKQIDFVFPLNVLFIITTENCTLPAEFDNLMDIFKLETQIVFWKIPFEDFIELELETEVLNISKAKYQEGVLSSSLFDIPALFNIINSVKGDFRAAWMRPRGVYKILDAMELDYETFELKVCGEGKTSSSCFITNAGDFDVIKVNEEQFLEFDEFIPSLERQAEQLNTEQQEIAALKLQQEEEEQQMSNETLYNTTEEVQQEETETDLPLEQSEAPIEADYAFKVDQKRTTIKELIERPDDIEIHPKRELRDLLSNFAPLDSIRNSSFPFKQPIREDKSLLFELQTLGELEKAATDNLKQNFGDTEPLFNVICDVVIRAKSEEVMQATKEIKYRAQTLVQNEEIQSKIEQFEAFEEVSFNSSTFIGQSIAFMLQNEQKLSFCHCDSIRFYSNDVIRNSDYFTIEIGFRRELQMPVLYQAVSASRGKIARICQLDECQSISLAFPSQVNVLHSKPLPVMIEAQKELFSARTREYSLNYELLERVILTGWPYRINRRKCICRFMFFNRKDVQYFEYALLTSKQMNGHITQVLGDKGYFKCFFDEEIQCGQVIEMKLYGEESGLGIGLGLWGLDGCGLEECFDLLRLEYEQNMKMIEEHE